MQLIGMLDSPYVRRVAIALHCLELPFQHRPISVFRAYAEFAAINPVVKAPTLVCDDGTVLMDSTLILDYAQALAGGRRMLMPAALEARQRGLRLTGLALAACEKSVQIVYEHNTRPAEKVHGPWIERITGQLRAAGRSLEDALLERPLAMGQDDIDLAGVTIAVTWHFVQAMTPAALPGKEFPALAALSAAAEELPAFRAARHGDGVYPTA